MPRVFENVGGLVPRRSVFDLSHDRKFDCDMGELIPILVEDVIPGDVFDISNEVVLRFHQSLFAPLLHEVNLYVHYFLSLTGFCGTKTNSGRDTKLALVLHMLGHLSSF